MSLKKISLILFCLFFVPSVVARAEEELVPSDSTTSTQAQCFQMLKDDMTEAGIFSIPLEEMEVMTYEDLETGFSRYYKGLSSFGNFEVDQPIVETRVYSFGEQTGYMHPTLTPYPVSTKSEVWDEPAKEFIILEEYVVDGSGERYFIDCGFVSIHSDRLAEVTRENYFYDASGIFLKKIASDGSYKSWYNEILSYDRENKPLARWKKLFVYPKTTQNEYFSNYDVADARLAYPVQSLDVLEFFLQPIIKIQDVDEVGVLTEKTYTEDEAGELVEITVPEALQSVKKEGVNTIFAKSEYYNAIEAMFPEFAKLLSFRGSLKYETLKKIISEEQDPEVVRIFNALSDGGDVRAYFLDKTVNERNGMVVEDPLMDALLLEVVNANESIQKITDAKSAEAAEKARQDSALELAQQQKELKAKLTIFMVLALLLLGTGSALFIARKRSHALGNDNAQ